MKARWLQVDWQGFGSTRSWFPRSTQNRRPWRPAGAFAIALDVAVGYEVLAIIEDFNRQVFGEPGAPVREITGLDAVLFDDRYPGWRYTRLRK